MSPARLAAEQLVLSKVQLGMSASMLVLQLLGMGMQVRSMLRRERRGIWGRRPAGD